MTVDKLLKPNEKIIQLIICKDVLYGLSSEGKIYQNMAYGDFRSIDHNKWRLIMGTLQEVFTETI